MNGSYHILAQTFGPWVQAVFFLFIVLLTAWWIGAIAFWSERKLLMTKHRPLAAAPLLAAAGGMLYGGLRFSGRIRYFADGWDQWGRWEHTYQNRGAWILFLCACILSGMLLAVYRETRSRKN